jgi:hypothetical protein
VNPDLELLVCADEEARARVDTAREDARRRIETARSKCDAVLRERKAEDEAGLTREIEALAEEGGKLVEDRRRGREALVLARRAETEPLLEKAATAYAALLRDGPLRRRT